LFQTSGDIGLSMDVHISPKSYSISPTLTGDGNCRHLAWCSKGSLA